MIRKLLATALIAAMLPFGAQNANAASEWDNAVTVYGAALEQDSNLQNETANLLGSEDTDIVDYVYSEDVNQYINQNYDNSVLKSRSVLYRPLKVTVSTLILMKTWARFF
jgi:hypothetical protein